MSIYLVVKNKLRLSKITIGTVLVAVVTFFVTSPVADKGIVSYFPFFLLPVITASFTSVILSWDSFLKAAPLAYISGTLGVLIGADFLHLPTLLNFEIEGIKNAVIGGASVFDMVFITGILAVFVDGILMYRQRIRSSI